MMPKKNINSYNLLDSGDFEKLEQIGSFTYIRPAPQAVWQRNSPEIWKNHDVRFERNSKGGGRWIYKKEMPEKFKINFNGLDLFIKNTSFGHIGLFPEQKDNQLWFTKIIKSSSQPLKLLNLFAYTGISSIKAAQAGANVTHVDAAPGVVNWAKDNLGMVKTHKGSIRWIVDDVLSFTAREIRRGNKFDAIIMDPPTFGRGPKKELWKIEDSLINLLKELRKLFSDDFKLFLLSNHTPNYTPQALKNILKDILPDGITDCGEMLIKNTEHQTHLPSGSFIRWKN